MLDFEYSIPTKVFFGKEKIEELAGEIKKYTNRVLFAYGGGSIKMSGLYDKISKILEGNKIVYKELSGIKPNPRIESVREGIKICREHKLGLILAVGGGSVIDCAKAVAAGFYYRGDSWDLYSKRIQPEEALPLGTVLTIAAAGSEMNGNSVISNEATQEKLVVASSLLRPKFSILDPAYTFTVPGEQTAAGVVDIFSHILEQYFSLVKGSFVQDRLAEALLKTCIEYGSLAIAEPKNYEARANLMWASSLALGGLLSYGKTGDWSTHYIEHEVSAIYDITHGVGLAIILPHWMEYVLDEERLYKFIEYARGAWGIEGESSFATARKGIEKTREFFKTLGMPGSLREAGVSGDRLEEMAQKATAHGELGSFRKLQRGDVLKILKAAF